MRPTGLHNCYEAERDLRAAVARVDELETIRAQLEQRAMTAMRERDGRIALLEPVVVAALSLVGWYRALDAGLRDPETPREQINDWSSRYDGALEALCQMTDLLPDDIAERLSPSRRPEELDE